MPGQTFAYLRVSKFDQDLEKNKLDILKLAHEQRLGHVEFVEEKISGKISWRKRQIAVILEQVQGGMPSLSASYPVWGAVCWSAWKFFP